nr:MAG TPA: hypothetical protein [Caudoviricetes sp.]
MCKRCKEREAKVRKQKQKSTIYCNKYRFLEMNK